jgi:hypothetical protein
MKFKVLGLILICLIIAGCLESPKTIHLSNQSGPGQIPKPYYADVDPWLDHSVFGIETLIGPGLLRSYQTNTFGSFQDGQVEVNAATSLMQQHHFL